MPNKLSRPAEPACLLPRLRVMHRAERAFGPGKADLLKGIQKTGSIRAAANGMGMSYNRAWMLVREMNRLFKEPLVTAERGGETGGGAKLTEIGTEALAHYLSMERACIRHTQADWRKFRKLLR